MYVEKKKTISNSTSFYDPFSKNFNSIFMSKWITSFHEESKLVK